MFLNLEVYLTETQKAILYRTDLKSLIPSETGL